MTGMLETHAIGADLARRDGPQKVRGTATYAFEAPVESAAFCFPVQATIARGRVTSIDTAAARAVPGVLAVLTVDDAERLASTEDHELAVLQTHDIGFRGQLVGAVVAETSEAAREAADLVRVGYDVHPHDTALSPDRDDLSAPEMVGGGSFETDSATGDVDAALAAADVRVDQTYTTAWVHNNPLEPHASTARWDPEGRGRLTLWDSTQGVHPTRQTLCTVLGLEPEQMQVISPFVGGGFGSKGEPHANTVLAAMAARAVPGRWVRLALTRQQMFTLVGHRTPTVQHVRLGADRAGHLTALAMDVVQHTSAVKQFHEQTAVAARMMYATPNRSTTHRTATLDIPVNSWFRAPGEAPGMFGPEVALDELAGALGIDPVELRVRNEPETSPEDGRPWSSRNLVACLREGADRFGWSQRSPRPRARLEDGAWVGLGVASAVYPVNRMPESTAVIRFEDGRYVVEIGAADVGTGTWTTLAQIAADALGVDVTDVEVRIGDTRYPVATVAGGSSGMNTWGTAVVQAAGEFTEKFGGRPEDGDEAEGSVGDAPADEDHASYAFGAHFVEARVDADTGEIRVPRMLGVFAAGRIINPRTARSQFIGGMTMGLSMALHEKSVNDPVLGTVMTHDLADYHIAANADVGDIAAHWVEEHDPYVNVMGSKGIGEIGIVGVAAAVANAVHNAVGVRVRSVPITLDALLPGLDGPPSPAPDRSNP